MKLRTVKGKLITVEGKLCTANFEYIFLMGHYHVDIEHDRIWGNSFNIEPGTYKAIYYGGAITYYTVSENFWCVDRCYIGIPPITNSFVRIPLPGVSGVYQTAAEAEAAAKGAESIITIPDCIFIQTFFDRTEDMFSDIGGTIYYKLIRIA